MIHPMGKQNSILVTVTAVGLIGGSALLSIPISRVLHSELAGYGTSLTIITASPAIPSVTTTEVDPISEHSSTTLPFETTLTSGIPDPAGPSPTIVVTIPEVIILAAPENNIVDSTNALRASIGVALLVPNNTLQDYARRWAVHMAETGSLAHSNITTLLGNWPIVGENVAQAASVEEAFAALTNSSAHQSAMIDASYDVVGVGVAVDANGLVWVTQVFAGQELPITTTSLPPTTIPTIPEVTTTLPEVTTTLPEVTVPTIPDIPLPEESPEVTLPTLPLP